MHPTLNPCHLLPKNKNKWPVNLPLQLHSNLQNPLPHLLLGHASGNLLRLSNLEVRRRSCRSKHNPVPFSLLLLLHLHLSPPLHRRLEAENNQYRVSHRTGHRMDAIATATGWALGTNALSGAAPARSGVRTRSARSAKSLEFSRLLCPKEVSKSINQPRKVLASSDRSYEKKMRI